MTRTIADRAQAAADHFAAQTADPFYAYPARSNEAAAAQLLLASLLGVPIEQITVASDGLRRHHQLGEPLLLTVSEPADGDDPGRTYRFILSTPHYDGEPFHLLDSCPTCGADVPVWTITCFTDLAPAVTHDIPANPTSDDTFLYDPGHRASCDYGPQQG